MLRRGALLLRAQQRSSSSSSSSSSGAKSLAMDTEWCYYSELPNPRAYEDEPDIYNGWRVKIGLEIHAQLSTQSKLFSSSANPALHQSTSLVNGKCAASYFDSAYPGTYPVLNKEAVTGAIKAAVVLNCKVNNVSAFERKHYFYQDMPLGYQITQQQQPIAENGKLEYSYEDASGESQTGLVHVQRIQIEQDSGKSVHDRHDVYSLVDLSRAGAPLVEIVFLPDISTAEQAAGLLKSTQELLRHTGVCDGNMEDGLLRCDVNVSVSKSDENGLLLVVGPRVEIKNLNSVQRVLNATKYEIERQVGDLSATFASDGINKRNRLLKETRGYDVLKNETYRLRSKESSEDYRFLLDPDLPLLRITDEEIEEIAASIPENPTDARRRLAASYGLDSNQTTLLMTSRASKKDSAGDDMLAFFERVCADTRIHAIIGKGNTSADDKVSYQSIFNLITTDLVGYINAVHRTFSNLPITQKQLVDLLVMFKGNEINAFQLKKILNYICNNDCSDVAVEEISVKLDMKNNTNESLLVKHCEDCVNDEKNSKQLKKYKNGNDKMINFFVGEVMRAMKGQFDPLKVEEVIRRALAAKK